MISTYTAFSSANIKEFYVLCEHSYFLFFEYWKGMKVWVKVTFLCSQRTWMLRLQERKKSLNE